MKIKKLTKNEKLFLKYQKAKEQRLKDAEDLKKMKKLEEIWHYEAKIEADLRKCFENGDTSKTIYADSFTHNLQDWEKFIKNLSFFKGLEINCISKKLEHCVIESHKNKSLFDYAIKVSWGLKGK